MRERHYYNAATLRSVLEELEEAYGLRSEEFYALYEADEVPSRVPRFARHVWASFYRDARCLEHADEDAAFVDGARRSLALG